MHSLTISLSLFRQSPRVLLCVRSFFSSSIVLYMTLNLMGAKKKVHTYIPIHSNPLDKRLSKFAHIRYITLNACADCHKQRHTHTHSHIYSILANIYWTGQNASGFHRCCVSVCRHISAKCFGDWCWRSKMWPTNWTVWRWLFFCCLDQCFATYQRQQLKLNMISNRQFAIFTGCFLCCGSLAFFSLSPFSCVRVFVCILCVLPLRSIFFLIPISRIRGMCCDVACRQCIWIHFANAKFAWLFVCASTLEVSRLKTTCHSLKCVYDVRIWNICRLAFRWLFWWMIKKVWTTKTYTRKPNMGKRHTLYMRDAWADKV